jgi:hypothetical protein
MFFSLLWDEGPMASKICFEALDRILSHPMASKLCFEALDRILRHKNENISKRPLGGMTVVIGEDS